MRDARGQEGWLLGCRVLRRGNGQTVMVVITVRWLQQGIMGAVFMVSFMSTVMAVRWFVMVSHLMVCMFS